MSLKNLYWNRTSYLLSKRISICANTYRITRLDGARGKIGISSTAIYADP